jgi:hypothetical protein
MKYISTHLSTLKIFFTKDLLNLFNNLWKFRKALWHHRWYDYSGTLHFMEISIRDISKNVKDRGNEVGHSRMKKVDKMNRAVEILMNIRESNYFDLVESEMGRRYNSKKFEFIPCEDNPNYYELVDYDTDEEKEFNDKYFSRVVELEEQEWAELWEILKGQDYTKFDKNKDWDNQFNGSGLRGWWD